MKIRYDFVTNSSSTSFVIISDGEFTLPRFLDAVGVAGDSKFADIYKELFKSFNRTLSPIRYEFDKNSDGKTFKEFVKTTFWNSSPKLVDKILEAESRGFDVWVGKLSSERHDIETFFCTEEFIIEDDKLYIDASQDGW